MVLAGFLSVLGPSVIAAYPRRILNVHPALIPSFCGPGMYGHHVHEAVLAYGAKISGATTHTENNKTAIIREIDGDNLRFYENTFTISDGGDSETLQLSRTVPELDYICENENRLWGCKGDTIYASKLGDIFKK